FSSRRRHTRCYRDWSSDVCSSDLADRGRSQGPLPRRRLRLRDEGEHPSDVSVLRLPSDGGSRANTGGEGSGVGARRTLSFKWTRSEERRVGKESRLRGWTAQENI